MKREQIEIAEFNLSPLQDYGLPRRRKAGPGGREIGLGDAQVIDQEAHFRAKGEAGARFGAVYQTPVEGLRADV